MKILTKDWREKYEQARVINWLKEVDVQKTSYDVIQQKSRDNFNNKLLDDRELAKLAFNTDLADRLYKAQIERDRKALLALPREIYSKIKDIKLLVLGFACKEDKEMLMAYANELYKKLEKDAETANRLTEEAIDCLPQDLDMDIVLGELAYEEYTEGKNYFINVGGCLFCIENYEIIERDDFKINEWEEENPLSLWTSLDAIEIHYINDKCFELHLLFADGDELENVIFWNFTLRGTNIKRCVN